jgi:hypothetical protein
MCDEMYANTINMFLYPDTQRYQNCSMDFVKMLRSPLKYITLRHFKARGRECNVQADLSSKDHSKAKMLCRREEIKQIAAVHSSILALR